MEIPAGLAHRVGGHTGDLARLVFRARRAEAQLRRRVGRGPESRSDAHPSPPPDDAAPRRRNVLLITVDQQRFDALGVHGQGVARTPHLDALAAGGLDYTRCHVQNVVCMPSRSTMLSGQHPYTHGVRANGVPLPPDALSVAEVLRKDGYRTALIGKAHFQPHFDLLQRNTENNLA